MNDDKDKRHNRCVRCVQVWLGRIRLSAVVTISSSTFFIQTCRRLGDNGGSAPVFFAPIWILHCLKKKLK